MVPIQPRWVPSPFPSRRLPPPPPLPQVKRELLVRLIYVDMLGLDASFGAMFCVTAAAHTNAVLKKCAYLATTLLLHPNHPLALLLTNTIQRDLASDNYLVVAAALDAACRLVTRETFSALLPSVLPRLTDTRPLIRKKACLFLTRGVRLDPDTFALACDPHVRGALADRDPSVLHAAVPLLLTVVEESQAMRTKLRRIAPALVGILTQILERRLPRSYDYHRVPAPFLQLHLVRVLCLLAENHPATGEGVDRVLQAVLSQVGVRGRS